MTKSAKYKNDSLGTRMKKYEEVSMGRLSPRTPLIIRLDGKAFHSWTRGLRKPFDATMQALMGHCALELVKQIQGAELAYTFSDEISVLVHYYKQFNSEPWFNNELQKIVSVSASIVTAKFNHEAFAFPETSNKGLAHFDSRVFTIPEDEVCNYFIWRMEDCVRNSIQSLARSLYSHKECNNKNQSDLQEMCFQKGHNWNDLETKNKRGFCVKRSIPEASMDERTIYMDYEIPTFTQNRQYIERHLYRDIG